MQAEKQADLSPAVMAVVAAVCVLPTVPMRCCWPIPAPDLLQLLQPPVLMSFRPLLFSTCSVHNGNFYHFQATASFCGVVKAERCLNKCVCKKLALLSGVQL